MPKNVNMNDIITKFFISFCTVCFICTTFSSFYRTLNIMVWNKQLNGRTNAILINTHDDIDIICSDLSAFLLDIIILFINDSTHSEEYIPIVEIAVKSELNMPLFLKNL